MAVRIFSPARNAMQSGKGKEGKWLVEHELEEPKSAEPLMGWTSSADTLQQVRLEFDTKEAAVAYAERNGLAYSFDEPPPRRLQKKSYSDNFRWGREDLWTH